MPDPIPQLQAHLRSSLDPVSAFFLVDSQVALARLRGKLECLSGYGVSAEQAAGLVELVVKVQQRPRTEGAPSERVTLHFAAAGQRRVGDFAVREAPGHGWEVELVLPGVIGSSAPGFLDNGFFCAFMPPSFYD